MAVPQSRFVFSCVFTRSVRMRASVKDVTVAGFFLNLSPELVNQVPSFVVLEDPSVVDIFARRSSEGLDCNMLEPSLSVGVVAVILCESLLKENRPERVILGRLHTVGFLSSVLHYHWQV